MVSGRTEVQFPVGSCRKAVGPAFSGKCGVGEGEAEAVGVEEKVWVGGGWRRRGIMAGCLFLQSQWSERGDPPCG